MNLEQKYLRCMGSDLFFKALVKEISISWTKVVYVILIWTHTVVNTYCIVLGGKIYCDIKKNIILR